MNGPMDRHTFVVGVDKNVHEFCCSFSGQSDPELSASTENRQSSSDADSLHLPPLLPLLCGILVHSWIHCLEV